MRARVRVCAGDLSESNCGLADRWFSWHDADGSIFPSLPLISDILLAEIIEPSSFALLGLFGVISAFCATPVAQNVEIIRKIPSSAFILNLHHTGSDLNHQKTLFFNIDIFKLYLGIN